MSVVSNFVIRDWKVIQEVLSESVEGAAGILHLPREQALARMFSAIREGVYIHRQEALTEISRSGGGWRSNPAQLAAIHTPSLCGIVASVIRYMACIPFGMQVEKEAVTLTAVRCELECWIEFYLPHPVGGAMSSPYVTRHFANSNSPGVLHVLQWERWAHNVVDKMEYELGMRGA